MATFSTNSVRHVVVANSYNNSLAGTTTVPASVNEANAGVVTSAVKVSATNELYLTYFNASGQEVKTDLIPIDKIRSVSVKPYAPKCLRKDSISFAAPVVGETYIIRLLIRSWGSGSAENQYFKHVGSYKAKTGDTADTLVDAFIASAAVNFAREPQQNFTFAKELGATAADSKLIISEIDQTWVQGKQQGRGLDYSIQFVKINSGGSEVYDWGTVTSIFKPFPGVGTSRLAADLEYFLLGERGDVYRNVGFPFTFDTKYLIDQTANYSTIDIAYYTVEPSNGGAVQSEKVLTILAKEAASTSQYTVVNAIISAVNTATGATTLPTGNTTNTGANIILKSGSLGTAGNTTATALTTATKYVIYVNPGTSSETKVYVKADGTTSATEADVANLTGTAVTGLTNGTRYFIKVY
jgi:hypothetical protein